MRDTFQKSVMAVLITSLVAGPLASPAYAGDDTSNAGIAAALGLTAAGGKTTLGSSAGNIEAALIQSSALTKAAWDIVEIMKARSIKGNVFLLSHTDQFDFSASQSFQLNIDTLTSNFIGLSCKTAAVAGKSTTGGQDRSLSLPSPTPKDVTALVATDTQIAGLTVGVDDRALIDAILASAYRQDGQTWTDDSNIEQKPTGSRAIAAANQGPKDAQDGQDAAEQGLNFVIPSELAQANSKSELLKNYRALLSLATKNRGCTDTGMVKAVAAVDAFATKASTIGDKAIVSPLIQAIEQEAVEEDGSVLRVAVEQTGGTTIVRSGVLYTLHLLNDATISSGLLVSFRLINPRNGLVKLSGFVRCASKPTNFYKVAATLKSNNVDVSCSYFASPKTS